jgi:hypothetical protein
MGLMAVIPPGARAGRQGVKPVTRFEPPHAGPQDPYPHLVQEHGYAGAPVVAMFYRTQRTR